MFKNGVQDAREVELEAENARLRELLAEATKAVECAQAQAAGAVEKTRFLDQLLDAVEQAVIATDLSGRVLHWNRFAASLYGWTAEEAVGRTVLELKAAPESQSDAERLLTLLQRARSGLVNWCCGRKMAPPFQRT